MFQFMTVKLGLALPAFLRLNIFISPKIDSFLTKFVKHITSLPRLNLQPSLNQEKLTQQIIFMDNKLLAP